jgi:hypothetical protein
VEQGIEIQDEEFTMNKSVALAVLAGGIILLFLGINAYDSSSSEISRFFTGSPTDKSVWMLVGGTVGTVIGLGGLLRLSRKT